MTAPAASSKVIQVGDLAGLGTIYDLSGELIRHPGEEVLRCVRDWDLDVMSPWRRVMPKTLFSGFHGRATSRLYVTSNRIVLVREVDEWRELAGELTPLGLPNATIKERRLVALKRAGVRQFCQIVPGALTLVSLRRYRKRRSILDMKLVGNDGREYAITIWKTDGMDENTLDLIQARFLPAGLEGSPH